MDDRLNDVGGHLFAQAQRNRDACAKHMFAVRSIAHAVAVLFPWVEGGLVTCPANWVMAVR